MSSAGNRPRAAGVPYSPSEAAELQTLDADFDSRPGWHTTLNQALWNWGRLIERLESGYGSRGHGIDDLIFDVRARDSIAEFISAASPSLSEKLAIAVEPLDASYLDFTVRGTELAEALVEPRPEHAWWWRRIPRFGPLHDTLRPVSQA